MNPFYQSKIHRVYISTVDIIIYKKAQLPIAAVQLNRDAGKRRYHEIN